MNVIRGTTRHDTVKISRRAATCSAALAIQLARVLGSEALRNWNNGHLGEHLSVIRASTPGR